MEIEIYQIPEYIDEECKIEIKEEESIIQSKSNDDSKFSHMIILELPTSGITGIKLNPKYYNILMVITPKAINFFEIPETKEGKIIIDKPRFIFNRKEFIHNEAIFNPSKSHNIACSCFDSTIRIWSIRKPSIQTISCSEIPFQMKWDDTGYLLGYFDESNFIKIYSILHKKEIFNLNFEERIYNFEFFGKDTILICNINKDKIIQYEYDPEPKEDLKILKQNNYKYIYKEKFNFFSVCNDCLLIYSNNIIKLFDDIIAKDSNLIIQTNFPMNNPKIIKTFKKNILFEILDVDQNNNAKLIVLKDIYKIKEEIELNKISSNNIEEEEEKSCNTEYSSFDDSYENLDKDYFKDCPDTFMDIKEKLNFRFNIYEDEYKKSKKYLEIEEIKTILEKNNNKNLIQRRKIVSEELEKMEIRIQNGKKAFNSIKEEYMFYLNLLIMDETNINLLSKYLSFLQKNLQYFEDEKIPHEEFNDELKYYSIFFEKDKIKKEYGNDFESEKTKLINLMEKYLNGITNKKLKELKNELKEEKFGRYLNQPVTYNTKELIYFYCYKTIYSDIFDKKNKSEEKLANKLYALEKILNNKIIENMESVDILIPLITFICNPGKKENTNFFLNMINSKSLTNEELLEKQKSLKCELMINNDKTKKELLINGKFYQDSKEICFENLDDKEHKKCEKYNFNYLVKNPPLKINIEKIKKHLEFVFKSSLFKEVFKHLTGNENYEKLFNDEMIFEYINKIKFLPINFSNVTAFIDCFSLITFISTMKKKINFNFVEYDEDISITLENGIIVAIIYHEFGHAINAVIAFVENKMKSNDTPRKKYLNFKEGGYYLELALFGRVIRHLTYGEVLYILNEDNYKKSLDNFKKGFMELSYKDLIINLILI